MRRNRNFGRNRCVNFYDFLMFYQLTSNDFHIIFRSSVLLILKRLLVWVLFRVDNYNGTVDTGTPFWSFLCSIFLDFILNCQLLGMGQYHFLPIHRYADTGLCRYCQFWIGQILSKMDSEKN